MAEPEGQQRRTKAPHPTITLQQIRELQRRPPEGASHSELAETYGLSMDAVDLLALGSRRKQRRRCHPDRLPGPGA